MSWLDLNSDTCIVWYVNEFYHNVQLWNYVNLQIFRGRAKNYLLEMLVSGNTKQKYCKFRVYLRHWYKKKPVCGDDNNADESKLSCRLSFATWCHRFCKCHCLNQISTLSWHWHAATKCIENFVFDQAITHIYVSIFPYPQIHTSSKRNRYSYNDTATRFRLCLKI